MNKKRDPSYYVYLSDAQARVAGRLLATRKGDIEMFKKFEKAFNDLYEKLPTFKKKIDEILEKESQHVFLDRVSEGPNVGKHRQQFYPSWL